MTIKSFFIHATWLIALIFISCDQPKYPKRVLIQTIDKKTQLKIDSVVRYPTLKSKVKPQLDIDSVINFYINLYEQSYKDFNVNFDVFSEHFHQAQWRKMKRKYPETKFQSDISDAIKQEILDEKRANSLLGVSNEDIRQNLKFIKILDSISVLNGTWYLTSIKRYINNPFSYVNNFDYEMFFIPNHGVHWLHYSISLNNENELRMDLENINSELRADNLIKTIKSDLNKNLNKIESKFCEEIISNSLEPELEDELNKIISAIFNYDFKTTVNYMPESVWTEINNQTGNKFSQEYLKQTVIKTLKKNMPESKKGDEIPEINLCGVEILQKKQQIGVEIMLIEYSLSGNFSRGRAEHKSEIICFNFNENGSNQYKFIEVSGRDLIESILERYMSKYDIREFLSNSKKIDRKTEN